MLASIDINQLSECQLRELAAQMQDALGERDEAIRQYRLRNEHLMHEIAILRRHRFGKRSESKSSSPQQNLLDDLVDEDIAAIETELETLAESEAPGKDRPSTPRRQPLPPQLPRSEIHHDPESTTCRCGCELTRIGEDVSEKLDYEPGQFSVERHIRSKWACKACETIVQAPVA